MNEKRVTDLLAAAREEFYPGDDKVATEEEMKNMKKKRIEFKELLVKTGVETSSSIVMLLTFLAERHSVWRDFKRIGDLKMKDEKRLAWKIKLETMEEGPALILQEEMQTNL